MSTELFTIETVCKHYPPPIPELLEHYAARAPMTQLPKEYRVTRKNPKPPLVHFAIPISSAVLVRYAAKHDLTDYYTHLPDVVSPDTWFLAVEHVSDEVEYDFDVAWPFEATGESPLILVLYNNYTMKDKLLVDEDQEDVIRMVQEALALDTSLRPKWYFDLLDPYEPDDGGDDDK